MASVIAKFQRCGKTNCHCYLNGSLHGPYFWLVSYVRSEHGKGKYRWKYLGKDPQSVITKLKYLGVQSNLSKDQLNSKIFSLKNKSLSSENVRKKNFSTKIFNFELNEVDSTI